jgi:copper(I)-binding protein
MSNRLLLTALLLPLLAACGAEPSSPIVSDARIVSSPMGGAAYFNVRNEGGADRLVAVSAPDLGDASIHTTVLDNGVMRMRPSEGLDLPAHGQLELKPGGNHVMIMGPNVVPGRRSDLTLAFEKAGKVTISARVEPLQKAHQ